MYGKRDWHWDFLLVWGVMLVMGVVLFLSLHFSIQWLCWVSWIIAHSAGCLLAYSIDKYTLTYHLTVWGSFVGLASCSDPKYPGGINLGWLFSSETWGFRLGAFMLCYTVLAAVVTFIMWIQLVSED